MWFRLRGDPRGDTRYYYYDYDYYDSYDSYHYYYYGKGTTFAMPVQADCYVTGATLPCRCKQIARKGPTFGPRRTRGFPELGPKLGPERQGDSGNRARERQGHTRI